MVDFTSGAYRFQQAFAEGDFHDALGVPEGARKLAVDVAAARLADRMPSITDKVTAVANVLVCRERRAVYQAVRDLRDHVHEALAEKFGDNLNYAIPNCRSLVWEHSCRLLGFDIDKLDSLPCSAEAATLAFDGTRKTVEVGGW
jgi:hypothetical protein